MGAFLLKLMALQALFVGCLVTYGSSQRQYFFVRTLPAKLAWIFFILATTGALLLLLTVYDPITAGVYVLAAIMVDWTFVILASPHFSMQQGLLACGGLLMTLTAYLG
ncbi:MAG: hypothetical protein AAGD10_12055 [Myxococcota bacterium]